MGEVGAGRVVGVWEAVSVRLVEMCQSWCWLGTEGCRQRPGGNIGRVFDQAEAKLQRQQLGSQAAVLLQQAHDSPLQHRVIGSPLLPGPLGGLVVFFPLVPIAIIFLLCRDELSLATRVVAVLFIAAAPGFRFVVGKELLVFEVEGVTQ